jgi:hypothetical protein
MTFARLLVLGASALALFGGGAYAADEKDPGFNALDKDHDGAISRAEAKGNPYLAKHFKEADKNGDGKLSRTEYLTVMAKKDAETVKEKVSGMLNKDKDRSSTGSTSGSKPSSSSDGGSSGK